LTTQHIPQLDKPNYSVADVAEFLTVTKSYVHQLCRSGELESFRIGNRRVIPAGALRSLIQKGYDTPQRPVSSNSCDALRKVDGEQCRNFRGPGSIYCRTHQIDWIESGAGKDPYNY